MRVLVSLFLSLLITTTTQAVWGNVLLQDASPTPLNRTIEQRLTDVVNHLEGEALADYADDFSAEGLKTMEELLSKVTMRNARAVQETRLLQLPQGGFEVRDIKVQVDMDPSGGSPYQYLVFTLLPDGRIDNVRFAMESKYYDELIKEGRQLNDFAKRQEIIQFVELFRTAYNRRDLTFIEKVFSNDALIIVGRVVQERPDLPTQEEQFARSTLSRDRIEFVRRSKSEYIAKLKELFQQNRFLKVAFDSLDVHLDERDPNVYGVTLKQRWRSSSYSDTGYVFLMIDFTQVDTPLIHVRSWQPKPFEDGSVVSLTDFKVIRVEE